MSRWRVMSSMMRFISGSAAARTDIRLRRSVCIATVSFISCLTLPTTLASVAKNTTQVRAVFASIARTQPCVSISNSASSVPSRSAIVRTAAIRSIPTPAARRLRAIRAAKPIDRRVPIFRFCRKFMVSRSGAETGAAGYWARRYGLLSDNQRPP